MRGGGAQWPMVVGWVSLDFVYAYHIMSIIYLVCCLRLSLYTLKLVFVLSMLHSTRPREKQDKSESDYLHSLSICVIYLLVQPAYVCCRGEWDGLWLALFSCLLFLSFFVVFFAFPCCLTGWLALWPPTSCISLHMPYTSDSSQGSNTDALLMLSLILSLHCCRQRASKVTSRAQA